MANGTPESEFSIECFQNYTAPEVFIQGLAGMVNQTDVETMIRAQKQMLQRFEKTNEMLTNCNALSASRLKLAGAEFKKHTQLLVDMKKDLDYIFKKIRALKVKLSTQYPEAFEMAQKASLANSCKEEDEFEDQGEGHSKKSSNLTKDISKSTETLRPSISQVFSKSPNDNENLTIVKDINQDNASASTGKSKNNSSSIPDEDSSKIAELKTSSKLKAAGDKSISEKEKRDSSSSSDNSNTCSSGDCTSDTG